MTKDEIKDLMTFFETKSIGRLKIKEGDFEIELEKQSTEPEFTPDMCPTQPPINVVVNEKPAQVKSAKDTINSQMVGTFYIAPSPGASPYVKIGQSVRKGEIIGIIEAMKIMNEIEAEFDCKITEILVADGQPVEFGMPLFGVEKL